MKVKHQIFYSLFRGFVLSVLQLNVNIQKSFRTFSFLVMLFFLFSCSGNPQKMEDKRGAYLVFESRRDLNKLTTIILNVYKKDSSNITYEIIDTSYVGAIRDCNENDTTWSFSVETPYIDDSELNRIKFNIYLKEFDENFFFSDIKVTEQAVSGGVYLRTDSFTRNGVKIKNTMSNNGFDLF